MGASSCPAKGAAARASTRFSWSEGARITVSADCQPASHTLRAVSTRLAPASLVLSVSAANNATGIIVKTIAMIAITAIAFFLFNITSPLFVYKLYFVSDIFYILFFSIFCQFPLSNLIFF